MFQVGLTKFRKTLNKVISGYNTDDFIDDLFDVTGSLLSPFKKAMDTLPRSFYDLSASDQTAVSYSNQFLTATGAFANARKGDTIIFRSGVNLDIEVQILKKVSNDLAIIVDCDLTISNGDTFRIWRSKAQIVTSAGAASVSATVAPATKAPLSYANFSFFATPVTTAAYVQLIASVGTTAVSQASFFMGSGKAMYLAFGGAGVEVIKAIIPPGGLENQVIDIPAGTRLSLKAVEATENGQNEDATDAGTRLIANFYG